MNFEDITLSEISHKNANAVLLHLYEVPDTPTFMASKTGVVVAEAGEGEMGVSNQWAQHCTYTG